jgi:hypothetical protein
MQGYRLTPVYCEYPGTTTSFELGRLASRLGVPLISGLVSRWCWVVGLRRRPAGVSHGSWLPKAFGTPSACARHCIDVPLKCFGATRRAGADAMLSHREMTGDTARVTLSARGAGHDAELREYPLDMAGVVADER